MSKKVKNLTLQDVVKLDKKLDERKVVHFPELNSQVLVDVEFRPTKITKYMLEYGIVMEEVKEKGIDQDTLANTMLIENMLLIRNFTSLEIPLSIAEIIAYAQRLVDLEILEPILKSFDEEQLNKLNRITKKTLDNLPLLQNKITNVFENIALKNMDFNVEEEVDTDAAIQESE